MEVAEGRERIGKGEGRVDLDICPGAPEFLVTPLSGACTAFQHSLRRDTAAKTD